MHDGGDVAAAPKWTAPLLNLPAALSLDALFLAAGTVAADLEAFLLSRRARAAHSRVWCVAAPNLFASIGHVACPRRSCLPLLFAPSTGPSDKKV